MDQLVAGRQTSKGRSFLTPRWRLESERAPMIRPGHRQLDETLEAKAARQASRLNDTDRRPQTWCGGASDRGLDGRIPFRSARWIILPDARFAGSLRHEGA